MMAASLTGAVNFEERAAQFADLAVERAVFSLAPQRECCWQPCKVSEWSPRWPHDVKEEA